MVLILCICYVKSTDPWAYTYRCGMWLVCMCYVVLTAYTELLYRRARSIDCEHMRCHVLTDSAQRSCTLPLTILQEQDILYTGKLCINYLASAGSTWWETAAANFSHFPYSLHSLNMHLKKNITDTTNTVRNSYYHSNKVQHACNITCSGHNVL